MVVSHEMPMWRTIDQRTWRPRRRPTPAPTIDEASTSVVLTGAPTSDEATHDRGRAALRDQAVDRSDPHDAPAEGAHDRPPAERRAERERRRRREGDPHRDGEGRPGGRRRRAPPRSPPSTSARRWPRGRTPTPRPRSTPPPRPPARAVGWPVAGPVRASRSATRPSTRPRATEKSRAKIAPSTPDGRQSETPPQFTASGPPAARAAPVSPPTRAWLALAGMPRHQQNAHHTTAPAEARADDGDAVRTLHGDDPGDERRRPRCPGATARAGCRARRGRWRRPDRATRVTTGQRRPPRRRR